MKIETVVDLLTRDFVRGGCIKYDADAEDIDYAQQLLYWASVQQKTLEALRRIGFDADERATVLRETRTVTYGKGAVEEYAVRSKKLASRLFRKGAADVAEADLRKFVALASAGLPHGDRTVGVFYAEPENLSDLIRKYGEAKTPEASRLYGMRLFYAVLAYLAARTSIPNVAEREIDGRPMRYSPKCEIVVALADILTVTDGKLKPKKYADVRGEIAEANRANVANRETPLGEPITQHQYLVRLAEAMEVCYEKLLTRLLRLYARSGGELVEEEFRAKYLVYRYNAELCRVFRSTAELRGGKTIRVGVEQAIYDDLVAYHGAVRRARKRGMQEVYEQFDPVGTRDPQAVLESAKADYRQLLIERLSGKGASQAVLDAVDRKAHEFDETLQADWVALGGTPAAVTDEIARINDAVDTATPEYIHEFLDAVAPTTNTGNDTGASVREID